MIRVVLLLVLARCNAELGYNYEPSSIGVLPAYQQAAYAQINQAHSGYEDHPDFQKHFYAFEAPYDSSEESERVERKLSALSQKNLQVVFIKAPENKVLEGAVNALAKQTGEDKTAIYVLNKQTDPDELASTISALRIQHKHKPQVHFVKYRTDAEAAYAQQSIQAQYGGVRTGHSLAAPELPQTSYKQLPPTPAQEPQKAYFPPVPQPELPKRGYLPTIQDLTQKEYPPIASAPAPVLPQSGYFLPTPAPALPQRGYLPPTHELSPTTHFPTAPAPELPQKGLLPPVPIPAQPMRGYLPTALAPELPQPGYHYGTQFGGSYSSQDDSIDLPPVPLAEQQLDSSSYNWNLDARTAQNSRVDFRVNERHRPGSRMVFPTDNGVETQPRNGYMSSIRRRQKRVS